jgi:hypothetical protein
VAKPHPSQYQPRYWPFMIGGLSAPFSRRLRFLLASIVATFHANGSLPVGSFILHVQCPCDLLARKVFFLSVHSFHAVQSTPACVGPVCGAFLASSAPRWSCHPEVPLVARNPTGSRVKVDHSQWVTPQAPHPDEHNPLGSIISLQPELA